MAQKNKGGRPSKFKPEFHDLVIEYAKAGKSITQIACLLDVTRESLYEWERENPEFSYTLTRARQFAQAWWEDKGQDGIEKPGFNASLWSKQVSCRFPNDYRETSRNEQQYLDANGNPTNPPTPSIEIIRDADKAD